MPTDPKDGIDTSKPLTLGDFRRMTANLPDDTIFLERARSEIRVVTCGDFEAAFELCVDEDLLAELGMEPADLGIPEGTDLDEVRVIAFTAWD